MLNGVNYWEHDANGGVTEVTDAKVSTNTDFSARVELAVSYHPVNQPPVMTERRILEVTPPAADGTYRIDWQATFIAGSADVELKGGTAGGGYAGLGVRISKDARDWWLINSEGRRAVEPPADGFPKGLHGQPARWSDFSFISTATGSPRVSPSSTIRPTCVTQRSGTIAWCGTAGLGTSARRRSGASRIRWPPARNSSSATVSWSTPAVRISPG